MKLYELNHDGDLYYAFGLTPGSAQDAWEQWAKGAGVEIQRGKLSVRYLCKEGDIFR